jgi:hypothetical protein
MQTAILKKHVEFDLSSRYGDKEFEAKLDAQSVLMLMVETMLKDEEIKPGDSIAADYRIKVTHGANGNS